MLTEYYRNCLRRLCLLTGAALGMLPNLLTAQLYRDIGNAREVQREATGFSLTADNGKLLVQVFSPSIVRFRYTQQDSDVTNPYSVVAEPVRTGFTLREEADRLVLTTDSMTVVVRKSPVRVQCLDNKGQVVNEDEPAFGTGWVGEEGNVHKALRKGERFIGLGEKTGPLDRAGNAYTNWNTDYFGYPSGADPIYASIPFYIGLHSQGMYGIFLDNTHMSEFNFGASNNRFSSMKVQAGAVDYYYMQNSSVRELIRSYTHLTGRSYMPPLWSLGYQQCRYSYYPDDEVLRIAQTFREKQIPADVIYLDIHYMDAYKLFTWHPKYFPNPKKLLTDLQGLGFQTTVIVDPGIKVEKGYEAYESGVKRDIFLKYPDGTNFTAQVWPGWCHFPDFTTEAGRNWWGEQFRGYVDVGVTGFWNDMNEPASWGQRIPDIVQFGFEGKVGTHRQGHNVYGLEMSRATYEGTRSLLGGARPFILTRAAFSGIQRYSAIWTGDNQSNSDHMLAGVRLVNSLGLSGVPFAGMDVGGFAGGPEATPELFGRWISIGAFTPFFRVHTAINTKESDPWSYGERVEQISRNYINLRYRLLPYLYSTYHEATRTGLPVNRSLAIDYSYEKPVYLSNFHNQFLFGHGLLVAPVGANESVAQVYLPTGSWYDFYNDRPYTGAAAHYVPAPTERLPVFVKAGAIVPMQRVVQHTGEDPGDTLDVHVYLGAAGALTYYEDDGRTHAYEQGAFQRRELRLDASGRRFSVGKAEGSYASKFRQLRLVVHGSLPAGSAPKVGARKVAWQQTAFQPMPPIERFDPLGSDADNRIPQYPSVVVPFGADAVEVSW